MPFFPAVSIVLYCFLIKRIKPFCRGTLRRCACGVPGKVLTAFLTASPPVRVPRPHKAVIPFYKELVLRARPHIKQNGLQGLRQEGRCDAQPWKRAFRSLLIVIEVILLYQFCPQRKPANRCQAQNEKSQHNFCDIKVGIAKQAGQRGIFANRLNRTDVFG